MLNVERELDKVLSEVTRKTGASGLIEQQMRNQAREYRMLEQRWGRFLEGEQDPWKRYCIATTMDNYVKEILLPRRKGYQEDVRVANIGSFDKFVFPIIRALFPNLAATELVSVQPMTAPVGLVFFFDYLYGTSKGDITAGDQMFRNPSAAYGSPTISDEVVTTGALLADAQIATNLAFVPIKPGSVTISHASAAGTEVITDDGAGGLVGDVGTGGADTINYSTGAIDTSFDNAVDAGVAVLATYDYDMEFNINIPQVDIVLTKAPVQAIERKLKSRWSLEAQQDLENLHGLSAETEVTNAITAELGFEVDLEVIGDLDNIAYDALPTEVPDFNLNPPTGVPWVFHKKAFKHVMLRASSTIHSRTGRAVMSWLVGGYDVVNLIMDQDDFEMDPAFTHEGRGIIKVGTWAGWDIYRNPNFDLKHWLAGFKPSSFANAGYVYAPYVPLYTTPLVSLEDFGVRKGLATRYGKRVINPDFYLKGDIIET